MGWLFCVEGVRQSHTDSASTFLQVDIASGMAIEHMCYAQVGNDCWFVHAGWGLSKNASQTEKKK